LGAPCLEGEPPAVSGGSTRSLWDDRALRPECRRLLEPSTYAVNNRTMLKRSYLPSETHLCHRSGGCRRVCIGVPALAHPPAGTERRARRPWKGCETRRSSVQFDNGSLDGVCSLPARSRTLRWCEEPAPDVSASNNRGANSIPAAVNLWPRAYLPARPVGGGPA